MHLNIFNKDQQELLPLLSKFKKEFYMVGGTSIALHIGHPMSIDFDLFSEKLFRGQLNYFTGINFEEQIDFIPGFETDENTIKEFLIDAALTGF
mgnify:CR=1 FL=1